MTFGCGGERGVKRNRFASLTRPRTQQRKAFVAAYKGHSLFITEVLISDTYLYTSSADHSIRVWDAWAGDATGDAKPPAPEDKRARKARPLFISLSCPLTSPARCCTGTVGK